MDKINKKTIFTVFFVALIGYFLFLVKNILLPFTMGFFIAYLCRDFVKRYEKKYPRGLVSFIAVSVVSLICITILVFILPSVARQIINLSRKIIVFIQNFDIKQFYDKHNNTLIYLNIRSFEDFQQFTNNIMLLVGKYIGNITNSIVNSSIKFFNVVFMVIISPITAFYFLRDWNYIRKYFFSLVPKKYNKKYLILVGRIDEILHHYIVGQINVSLSVFVLYLAGLLLVGFDYSFVVASISAVLTLLPYVGAFGGGAIAVIINMLQYGFVFKKILPIIAVFCFGQFVEGNFVTPMLIGNKIKLHPLWVVFSMFAGGSLYGFWGVVLGMPIAGIIGVLVRFYNEEKSKLANKESN